MRLAFATPISAFRFLVRSLRCALVIEPLPLGKSSLTPTTIILEEPVTAMKIRQPTPVATPGARGRLTGACSLIYRRGTVVRGRSERRTRRRRTLVVGN